MQTWRTYVLMQEGGEGVRMHWEAETPTHTLLCEHRSLVGAAALHRALSSALWGDPEHGREAQRAGGTCMHTTHDVMCIHTTRVYTHSHRALQQKPTQR